MFICYRIWKKSPKAEGIASIALDQVISGSKTKFIRWKVHGDWVQQVETETDVATHWCRPIPCIEVLNKLLTDKLIDSCSKVTITDRRE